MTLRSCYSSCIQIRLITSYNSQKFFKQHGKLLDDARTYPSTAVDSNYTLRNHKKY